MAEVRHEEECHDRGSGPQRHRPFCYKGPRFCHTLHAWRPHFDLNSTVFVCIVRPPVKTARSIARFCRGM